MEVVLNMMVTATTKTTELMLKQTPDLEVVVETIQRKLPHLAATAAQALLSLGLGRYRLT